MLIRQILMAVIGLSAGILVAGGLFGFIVELGVIADFADRTHTGNKIHLYEDCAALGGIIGNVIFVYSIPIPYGTILSANRDFCRVLGDGTGRNSKCFSDIYP